MYNKHQLKTSYHLGQAYMGTNHSWLLQGLVMTTKITINMTKRS